MLHVTIDLETNNLRPGRAVRQKLCKNVVQNPEVLLSGYRQGCHTEHGSELHVSNNS